MPITQPEDLHKRAALIRFFLCVSLIGLFYIVIKFPEYTDFITKRKGGDDVLFYIKTGSAIAAVAAFLTGISHIPLIIKGQKLRTLQFWKFKATFAENGHTDVQIEEETNVGGTNQ